MVREKKRLKATYLFIALLVTVIFSVWIIETVAANSAKPSAPDDLGTAQKMSTTSFNGAFVPVLKADKNGRLLLAYNHNTSTVENPSFNPYYRESTNGGGTWSEPSAIQLGGNNMLEVTFAFDSNNVAHAVWRTQYEIWHAPENGWPASANSNQVKSNTGALVFSPDIAVSPDNTLHVVWAQENKIFHTFSKDGGQNWSTPYPLSPGTGQLKSDVPDVEVDHLGNVHVVWEERISLIPPVNHEIHYKKGTLSGGSMTWSPSPKVLSPGVDVAKVPAIHINGDVIHVAFADRISNITQYAYYVNATLSSNWSAPLDITQGEPLVMNTNIPFVLMPSLDSCSSDIHVLFHGALAENHSERIMGVESGDNFTSRDQITEGQSRTIRPSLACTGGMLHVVYEIIQIPNEIHHIYYVAEMANAVYLPTLQTH